jgi:hypothetical protein
MNAVTIRRKLLAMASPACTHCHGFGCRVSEAGRKTDLCRCVDREVFRIVFRKYQELRQNAPSISKVSVQLTGGSRYRRVTWGRKNEEFMADFELIAKRVLTGLDFRILTLHVLQGLDWKICTAKLGMDKGLFFHHVYKIQALLGRAYREVRPYSLFPIDEYYAGTTGDGTGRDAWAEQEAKVIPMRKRSRLSFPLPEVTPKAA